MKEPGTQDLTGPQTPQATQTQQIRSCGLWPRWTATATKSQRQGWGKGLTPASCPGPRQWATLARALEPEGHSPQHFPGALAHPLARSQVNLKGWKGAVRAGSASYLTFCFTALLLRDLWLNVPENGLHAWGRGPLWCLPMAEQDH